MTDTLIMLRSENKDIKNILESIKYSGSVDVKNKLKSILSTLNSREQGIIKHRVGLNGNPRTLAQCGVVYGISRERIRQIESKALRRLRHPSRIEKIKALL